MGAWWYFYCFLNKFLGKLDVGSEKEVSSEGAGKKLANFSRNVEDFMGEGRPKRDQVSPITTKQIRLSNEEFLWSKGIKIPDAIDEETGKAVKEKPARVPGAPSPEPEKKRKRNKKKKPEGKSGVPTY